MGPGDTRFLINIYLIRKTQTNLDNKLTQNNKKGLLYQKARIPTQSYRYTDMQVVEISILSRDCCF